MAAVSFQGVWLQDAANLLDAIHLRHAEAVNPFASRGEVRVMANGRRVWINRPGATESVTYRVQYIDAAQVRWLRERVMSGRLLLARDSRSRKWWGVIPSASPPDRRIHGWELEFTFEPLTYSEAV
jgi:hypothetical protein